MKASTLMETLVASLLIVVIFMISSMILNNLFSNTIKNITRDVDNYLNELQYLYVNEQLNMPYQVNFGDWNISISSQKSNQVNRVLIEAENVMTRKTISRTIHENP